MNRQIISIVVAFVLMMGAVAGLLVRVRANYVLGEPGIKLTDVPLYDENTNLVSNVSAYLPESVGDYKATFSPPVTTVETGMLPPDTVYGRRVYTAEDGFQALISVVVMGTDRTSIHKPQYCLTGMGETIESTELVTIPMSKPHPYELQVMKLRTSSQEYVDGKFIPRSGMFIYWFVADGQLTPHHGERMWLMGRDLFTKGLLQRWAYIAYYSRCNPGEEDQLFDRLKSFIAESVPEFQITAGANTEATAAVPLDAESSSGQNPPAFAAPSMAKN